MIIRPAASKRRILLSPGVLVPLRIIYSHNKSGPEGERWSSELRSASDSRYEIVPFNHLRHTKLFYEAQALDFAWRDRDKELLRLYSDLETLIRETKADVLFVTNASPYHPDFLAHLPVYRVLYSTDDPAATYSRTIPYLHGYHHVMFCTPLHSPEKTMEQKMSECGMTNADWLPLGVFDYEFDAAATEDQLFSRTRDIDVVYVGGCFLQKLPLLARVQKAFGRRFKLHGVFHWKHNAYFIARHGSRQWVTRVSNEERLRLYQRARIGFNIHWDEHSLGNQRLYHLPANGVMQISDCASDLGRVYEPGKEIAGYRDADELVDLIRHYLANDDERVAIARAGYRRTMRDYRIADVTRHAGALIEQGMKRAGWRAAADA